MSIPFIDLKTQYRRIQERVQANVDAVLEHGRYVMGPEIRDLEALLADYAGRKHAVACGSGTDALMMSLMALGVGPGDAVFTTPFTFMATAETICLVGATPVFVDVDPATCNMDPAQLRRAVEALVEKDEEIHPLPSGYRELTPRGIIAVDLFGLPADYDAIEAVAEDFSLFLLGDAAQSFGATYKGAPVLSKTAVSSTSFFPAKPLGAYGDAGMCFTDDERLHELLLSIRIHGQGTHKYDNMRMGLNARMDTIQAAVLLAKFEVFPEEVELRNEAAARYGQLLAKVDGLTLPEVPEGYASVWAQYSVLAPTARRRDAMQKALAAEDIPTAIYYPIPLHLQTAYSGLEYAAGDLPVCEDMAERIFSLPMHPYLEEELQERIAGVLAGA